MTHICDGCVGSGYCSIQDDLNDSKYSCLIPERFRMLNEKAEKIEAVKNWFEENKHKKIIWYNWKEFKKILALKPKGVTA